MARVETRYSLASWEECENTLETAYIEIGIYYDQRHLSKRLVVGKGLERIESFLCLFLFHVLATCLIENISPMQTYNSTYVTT